LILLFPTIPSIAIFSCPFGQLTWLGYPKTLNIFKIWSKLLAPGNKGKPVYNSTITHPNENTSIAQVYYFVPNKFSGALYHLVAI
jgi:hypothetical protein